MSFANEWLRFLESQEEKQVKYLILRGEEPEDMPYTEISFDKRGGVRQTYFPGLEKEMKIPDKIGIKPIDVKIVEIKTSDELTFHVYKPETEGEKPKIRIDYRGLKGKRAQFSLKKEKDFWDEIVKNLGYEISSFILF